MKAKVSLNLSRLSVAVKIEKGRHIVTSMTNNAGTFVAPKPTLASVTVAINNLETAFNNAQNGGKTLTAIMHEKEVILDDLLTQLGHYVEDTANGIASIILLSGMDLKKPKTPVGPLAAPANLRIKITGNPGEIQLRWNTVKHTFNYVIQMAVSTDGGATYSPFNEIGFSTKAKFLVTGLTSGTRYAFRVATLGTAGLSPWSNPVFAMSL